MFPYAQNQRHLRAETNTIFHKIHYHVDLWGRARPVPSTVYRYSFSTVDGASEASWMPSFNHLHKDGIQFRLIPSLDAVKPALQPRMERKIVGLHEPRIKAVHDLLHELAGAFLRR